MLKSSPACSRNMAQKTIEGMIRIICGDDRIDEIKASLNARLFLFSCKIGFMINLLRWILRRFVNLIADVKIVGLENIPTTGAFVITTNHLGLLDAAMLYYFLDRTDVFIPV